jgi:hypothetical protein
MAVKHGDLLCSIVPGLASAPIVIQVEALPFYEAEAKERQLIGNGADGSGGRGKKKEKTLEEKIPQGKGKPREKQARAKAAKAVGTNEKYVSVAMMRKPG